MTASDRRPASRRRICCAGTVAVDPVLAPIEVLIRNMSETGASIRIMDSRHLPSPFRLLVGSTGVARRAQIVWKNGRDVGVVFAAASRAA